MFKEGERQRLETLATNFLRRAGKKKRKPKSVVAKVDKRKHRYIKGEQEPDSFSPEVMARRLALVEQMVAQGQLSTASKFYTNPELINWKQEDRLRQKFAKYLISMGQPWLHIVKYD